MIAALLIPCMSILARMHGGGLGGEYLKKKGLRPLLRLIIALLIASPYFLNDHYVIAMLSATGAYIASFFVFVSGHGIVLPWGRDWTTLNPDAAAEIRNGRTEDLQPYVDEIAKALKIKIKGDDGLYSLNYCRLFMAVKGFLIGGFLTAIIWPIAYEIGARTNRHELAEFISGAGLGLNIYLMMIVLA